MEQVIIEPAQRTLRVSEYYFSKKRKQLDEMKRQGLDVINLGIGSPDMPPSEDVLKALYSNAADKLNHGYQSYTGTPELRRAFSDWYKRFYNVSLDADSEILPLVGSKEGIMHISMAFLDDGDEALVPDPGYPTYAAATQLAGGRVRYYDLTAGNSWLPDLDRLESEDLGRVKLMWVNYPHMPTGRKADRAMFSRLVSFARRHGILLCNDNPYSFILNDEPVSLLESDGARDVVLELNSLSKSHNMAGWRIGMVAGNRHFINAILRVKSNMDSGMFQPLQAAAVEALNAPASWYSRLNTIYRHRRTAAGAIMDALGCCYDPCQSGLFLWGEIPSEYNSGEELSDYLLSETNVFITPGSVFGNNGKRFVRISLCSTEEVLQEAARRIGINNKLNSERQND